MNPQATAQTYRQMEELVFDVANLNLRQFLPRHYPIDRRLWTACAVAEQHSFVGLEGFSFPVRQWVLATYHDEGKLRYEWGKDKSKLVPIPGYARAGLGVDEFDPAEEEMLWLEFVPEHTRVGASHEEIVVRSNQTMTAIRALVEAGCFQTASRATIGDSLPIEIARVGSILIDNRWINGRVLELLEGTARLESIR